jgi:hypothetical protein
MSLITAESEIRRMDSTKHPILMNDIALSAIIQASVAAESFRDNVNYTVFKGFPRVTCVTLW